MDNRAIGVFDSGLGGLTAVKEGFPMVPEAVKPSLNMHSRTSTF